MLVLPRHHAIARQASPPLQADLGEFAAENLDPEVVVAPADSGAHRALAAGHPLVPVVRPPAVSHDSFNHLPLRHLETRRAGRTASAGYSSAHPGGDFAPAGGSVDTGPRVAGAGAAELGVADDSQRGFRQHGWPVPGRVAGSLLSDARVGRRSRGPGSGDVPAGVAVL